MNEKAAQSVLVTGFRGFIGYHVASRFALGGHRVIGIGHARQPGGPATFHDLALSIESDVTLSALRSLEEIPSIIIHCAGDSSVGPTFSNPDEVVRRNLDAAIAVLAFAGEMRSPPKVVVLSSAAVYGASETLPIAESAPLRPISPYGRAKIAVEEAATTYAKAQGIPVCVLRLFSVYGPGLRKQLFWDACRKFAAGDSEFSGTGDERRDWLHIEDAVSLIMMASGHASPDCTVLNGGSGKSLSVRDALALLHEVWEGTVSSPTFTGQGRRGDPHGYEADMSKAKVLGWSPQHGFEHGIADYARWARGVLT